MEIAVEKELELAQQAYDVIVNFVVNYSFQLIGAVIILIAGFVIGMFVIIAVSKLGLSITPLIAALGGLAVGASFAIQGPVSNYGTGFVIILTRMFKVGDTISVQGCFGVVKEITLATTQLVVEDGKEIVIPNKHVVGEIHRNAYANRLVEGSI
jgi:small conductance mechanosensitive channel